MIRQVSLTAGTTFADPPWRFEAGSPNSAGIMGAGGGVRLRRSPGPECDPRLRTVADALRAEGAQPGADAEIYGPAHRAGVIAFNLGEHHAYDVGSFLDQYGIAIRTGHHCAMPLMAFYQVPSMCRASLALYNTREEVDRLVAGLQRIHQLLG